MKGKNCRQFSSLINMEIINRSVKSSCRREWKGDCFYPAASFTLLENMKNLCKIQVIK